MIPIGNNQYLEDSKSTDRWFDTEFINAFTSLVAHEAHLEQHSHHVYKTIQLVHCPYPNSTPVEAECIGICSTVNTLVSVLHSSDHCAIPLLFHGFIFLLQLVVNVRSQTIMVYDGLVYGLTHWQAHVVNVLKRCNLMKRTFEPQFRLTKISEKESMLAIIADDGLRWIIHNAIFVRQQDYRVYESHGAV